MPLIMQSQGLEHSNIVNVKYIYIEKNYFCTWR